MKNELSYLDRIVTFRKEAKKKKLKCSIKEVYASILVIFNDHGWDNLIKITYEDIESEANMSLSSIKRAMVELCEFGFIDYRSKQGSKYIYCSLDDHFSDDISYDNLVKSWIKSQKKYIKTRKPNKQTSKVIEDKPIPLSLPTNSSFPDKAVPPDDGIKRNYEGLQERLRNIKCPPDLFKSVVVWSNYGQNGHKIWEILDKIRDDKGLKVPLDFLKSRMQKAIAEGYVARPVY
ncbi:MAG: hypothetical protein LBQ74_15150, partial [Prevotella sp.]|nr:hypothetical protein [Prevotella sp.]